MHRSELRCSDTKITYLLNQGWGIVAEELTYINGGSYFSFVVKTENADRYYLKVYPKHAYSDTPTEASLDYVGKTLYRLRHHYGINHISYGIARNDVEFCLEDEGFIFSLYEFIEGVHPAYSPNELYADELALILSLLHQVPAVLFSELKSETFDTAYAEGVRAWLDADVHKNKMLQRLQTHREALLNCIENVVKKRDILFHQHKPFVITHGDVHHLNVLQHQGEAWLVDWDSIKLAPPERDLWHYQEAAVVTEYSKLHPEFEVDKILCEFYQHQRFLEDIHYYLEQVLLDKAKTKEQKESDKCAFLQHWGWKRCLSV